MKEISECIGDIGRANSTIFSTIDLTSGFWQMPIATTDRHLTAFTVPGKGQFEWIRSPMGLFGCPASFQRMMEGTVRGITNVIIHIDDILIHSDSHEAHLRTLDELLQRLQDNLKINLKKSHFGNPDVTYLGFRLTSKGILPGRDKLDVLRKASPPMDIKGIKSFIGLCNFFRTHIKDFAIISSPLTKLTRKDAGYTGGELPPDALKAFHLLKNASCSNPVVDFPRSDRTYALIVDAATGTEHTEGGLGAILAQIDKNNRFHVISYGSRQLQKNEKNYSPFLLEMAAAAWGMDFYNEYLKGKRFVLFTDHKPLEKLGHLHRKTLNRLQLAMLEYDFVIQYKQGINMPADFLSRNPFDEPPAISNITQDLDPFQPDLKNLQLQDQELLACTYYIKHGTFPQDVPKQTARQLLPVMNKIYQDKFLNFWVRLDDNNYPRSALWLPHKYRKQMLCQAHGHEMSGHDGHRKTYIRLTTSFFWPSIQSDIRNHIRTCLNCQIRKKQVSVPTPLKPLPIPDQPNQRIHVDLFGPLISSDKAKKFLLCITDAFSKYSVVTDIPDKKAETVASAIYSKWFCVFGILAQIHSDGGKEFVNNLSDNFFKLLNIQHSKTSPAHPQCNAQVEVFNKFVQKFLASYVDASTLNWEEFIPALSFAYNTSYHSTIATTPFELLFGMKPILPALPAQDIQRIHYGEDFASDRIRHNGRGRLP